MEHKYLTTDEYINLIEENNILKTKLHARSQMLNAAQKVLNKLGYEFNIKSYAYEKTGYSKYDYIIEKLIEQNNILIKMMED